MMANISQHSPPCKQAMEYDPHQLAQEFPRISGLEFDNLVADICANGLQHPIVLYEGKILDGWHRYRACVRAGIEPRFEEYTGSTPAAYVCSANVFRRHLRMSNKRKRHLIDRVLTESPELSNRQIGKITRTDHKTVAAKRDEREGRGEIPTSKTRKDSKGRRQPARKPRKPEPKPPLTGCDAVMATECEMQGAPAVEPEPQAGLTPEPGWPDLPPELDRRVRRQPCSSAPAGWADVMAAERAERGLPSEPANTRQPAAIPAAIRCLAEELGRTSPHDVVKALPEPGLGQVVENIGIITQWGADFQIACVGLTDADEEGQG
jgi:hypothetical protein